MCCLLALWSALCFVKLQECLRKLREVFIAFDEDSSGDISREEFEAVCETD